MNYALLKCSLAVLLVAGVAVSNAQSSSATQQRAAALQLEESGQTAEAETAWRAIVRVHPTDADAYGHLGLLESKQEHFNAAVPYYRKALALNPAMSGIRLNLGLALFKSGSLKLAIEAWTPLLKATPPSSPDAIRLDILMGMAHYGLGEYAAAVPYLRKVTAADPQNLPKQTCWQGKRLHRCKITRAHWTSFAQL
jgi:tetratricopeptide (TPR) repeat protein